MKKQGQQVADKRNLSTGVHHLMPARKRKRGFGYLRSVLRHPAKETLA